MAFIVAKRWLLFVLVWLVLSRGEADALLIGGLATAAATAGSLALLPPSQHQIRLWGILRLLPGFLLSSLTGGIDVARRALHPRLPLTAGWVAYRTRLPRGLPRVSFGCETSLLPGSLVAGGRGNVLYVHCLDTGQDITASLAQEEARIGKALAGTTAPAREDGQ